MQFSKGLAYSNAGLWGSKESKERGTGAVLMLSLCPDPAACHTAVCPCVLGAVAQGWLVPQHLASVSAAVPPFGDCQSLQEQSDLPSQLHAALDSACPHTPSSHDAALK